MGTKLGLLNPLANPSSNVGPALVTGAASVAGTDGPWKLLLVMVVVAVLVVETYGSILAPTLEGSGDEAPPYPPGPVVGPDPPTGAGASANSTVNVDPGPNPSGTMISFSRPSGA